MLAEVCVSPSESVASRPPAATVLPTPEFTAETVPDTGVVIAVIEPSAFFIVPIT